MRGRTTAAAWFRQQRAGTARSQEVRMFELIFPYILAGLMGISPAPSTGDTVAAATDDKGKGTAAAPEAVAEAAAAAPAREPETQIATGRFTTALEIKPIMTATKPQWLAVREYDGQDLLYFTQVLSWRCGLWEVRYGLNGAPPDIVLPLEPCHDDTAQPNSLVDSETYPIWITAPLGSIESVDIEILYDDGTTDAAVFARNSILMPG
jgi:hypothetical protein